jgi:hypothetical protein
VQESALNQAYLISLPVTAIQSFDEYAGEGWTVKTKINLVADCTGFDFTDPAMLRFAFVHPMTAHTSFLFL